VCSPCARSGLAVTCLVVATLLLASSWHSSSAAEKPEGEALGVDAAVASQLRELIPRASGLPSALFKKIAQTTVQVDPEFLRQSGSGETLTVLFLTKGFPKPLEGGRNHFRLAEGRGALNPAALARELCREHRLGPLVFTAPYATMIHADRITKLTCTVEGEKASGTVVFQAPGLYEGDVDYVAERADGQWRITEFLLPGYGLKTVRTGKGAWEARELKPN